jgi:NAD(P)-dependent dehydrogenase (short-subunit alcohol dehydrogenase family)
VRLKDKVVIVTGAAMGLGKVFSVALATGEGAKVMAVDIADCTGTIRRSRRLAALPELCGQMYRVRRRPRRWPRRLLKFSGQLIFS